MARYYDDHPVPPVIHHENIQWYIEAYRHDREMMVRGITRETPRRILYVGDMMRYNEISRCWETEPIDIIVAMMRRYNKIHPVHGGRGMRLSSDTRPCGPDRVGYRSCTQAAWENCVRAIEDG